MTVTRRHETREGWREAVYSDCAAYRYVLTVSWDDDGRRLLYVMLNPSKATELANDPTIERCERRARQLGYGAFAVVNLFALRETSPQRLKAAAFPEGPGNARFIQRAVGWADDVLLAWGIHGAHLDKGDSLLSHLQKRGTRVMHLGLTKDGHPRHPLYVSYKTRPIYWQ